MNHFAVGLPGTFLLAIFVATGCRALDQACAVHDTCFHAASEAEVEEAENLEASDLLTSLLQTRLHVEVGSNGGSQSPPLWQEPPPTIPTQANITCAGQIFVCQRVTKRDACINIPSCNWEGVSAFGGWCSGPRDSCLHQTTVQGCKRRNGCQWQEAKQVAQEQHKRSCTGDGSQWQNPSCSYASERQACLWMPGCSWLGASAYGGWCKGGPTCAFETDEARCFAARCSWHRAIDA